jgi:hypothetical protein
VETEQLLRPETANMKGQMYRPGDFRGLFLILIFTMSDRLPGLELGTGRTD